VPRSAGSSFATGFYGNLPLQDVEIIHAIGSPDERRFQTQALINKGDGAFAVDTPIYEGDIVELDDPRGGRRQLVVDEIEIYDMRSNSAFAGMSRITAKWVPSNRKNAKRDEAQAPSQTVSNYHGPVITVHGDGARLAWSKTGNVTQNNVQEVAPGFESLADAVAQALEYVANAGELADEDREIAEEAGTAILAEVVSSEPDRSAIRRQLASLRGAIAPILMQASADAGAAELMQLLTQPFG
jgi:hypothetical protein